MAGESFIIKIDRIPEIIAELREQMAQAVEQTAHKVRESYATQAPEQTGFMASSAYVVTKDSSTYGKDLEGSGDMLPEVEHPTSEMEALIAVAASYAAFQEYGTVHDPAQPAFHPAFDTASSFLQGLIESFESEIK